MGMQSYVMGAVAGLSLAFAATVSNAATVSFSTYVTGENLGSVEVASLEATQSGSDVLFTLTATLASHANSFIDYLRLNYTGSAPTGAANVGGVAYSSFSTGAFNDASYMFNIDFDWPNNNNQNGLFRLNPGESSTFKIVDVDLSMFDFTSYGSPVHVNGLNSRGSTKYTGADVSAVPLPAAGWLMLAGMGGLAALRRRKRA